MIRNYFTIAYRNLTRQLSYSVINITGLAIGIACSLVIFIYVYQEWSADKRFANSNRVYRVGWSFFNIGNFAVGPEILPEVLPVEFAGIEAATRIKRTKDLPVKNGDKTFVETTAYYVDSSFFRVFDYPFVMGDPASALKDPHSIVLTEEVALKYFGTTEVVGKVLEIGKEKKEFTIGGVVEDSREYSHLKSKVWINIHDFLEKSTLWTSASTYNYFLVKENVSEQDFQAAMERLLEKQIYPSQAGMQMGLKFEDWKNNPNSIKYFIQPLESIYLKSKLNFEISPGGNEASLYIFGAIASFILLLASVNFVNLTTARASGRAKEVGIRKSLGTSRTKLVFQFLMESMTISLLAMLLSLAFAELFLSAFKFITGTSLVSSLWSSPFNVLLFVLFAVVVGLLSGIYPAFYLTAFKPASVLKGNLKASGGRSFRNILVVFQFSISICLIICTSIILRQLNYMQSTDLGFTQDHVLTIDGIDKLGTSAETFKNEVLSLAGVKSASIHSGEPGSKAIMSFYLLQTPQMGTALSTYTYFGDHDYLDVMGYKLIKGTNFTDGLKSDTTSIILNESAVKALGLEENPIGERINNQMKVVGVVRDFHWETLRNAIAPIAIMLRGDKGHQLALKISTDKPSALLKALESKWKEIKPDETFKYHFLDENFGELTKKEEVFGKAITFFTILAILISCLGLYGLAAFTSEQRTKEIGIRKALGASSLAIVMMLNRNFTRLVLISIILAAPVAWYIADQWLAGFAYRAPIQLWIFLAGAVSALVLALVTVSYHSLKASSTNPVDTLKYE